MSGGRERHYALDTNLFIRAYRNEADRVALESLLQAFAPSCYLPVIVALELLAGVRSAADERKLDRHLIGGFERRNRILTPSTSNWIESGRVLRALARDEGLALSRVSQSSGNDIPFSLTCREQGTVLITNNHRDFARIREHAKFEFVAPYPTPRIAEVRRTGMARIAREARLPLRAGVSRD